MGLIVDTSVFIAHDRSGQAVDFRPWRRWGEVALAAVTVAELLHGVYKAPSARLKLKRSSFVDNILDHFPVVDFDRSVARRYALLISSLEPGITLDAHDMQIAATAIEHDAPVLTLNVKDFARMPGAEVLDYAAPPVPE